MTNPVADIADVLIALAAVCARACAHGVEEDVRATVRAAESGGVHLLSCADQLWRVAHPARLLWREAWAGPVIEHYFAVMGGLKKGHVSSPAGWPRRRKCRHPQRHFVKG